MFEGDFAVEDRPIDRDVERRAIAEKRFVQSSPVRVRIVTLPLSRWICRRWPSYLISWSQLSPAGGFDLREAS